MGVTSVGPRETVRFGEENDPEEEDMDGVAHNSKNLDETQKDDDPQDNSNPGADETLRGYGRASLAECLERMGAQPNTTTPATGASGEGQRDTYRPATGHEPKPESDPSSGLIINTWCTTSRRLFPNQRSKMQGIGDTGIRT